jgi:hypothetical protein
MLVFAEDDADGRSERPSPFFDGNTLRISDRQMIFDEEELRSMQHSLNATGGSA